MRSSRLNLAAQAHPAKRSEPAMDPHLRAKVAVGPGLLLVVAVPVAAAAAAAAELAYQG